MIVRRYVVKDMPEAVVSIRNDLGKDAVILSTKRVRVKKWLGLLWNNRLEVTAAVGDDIPLYRKKPTPVKQGPKEDKQKPVAEAKPTNNMKAVAQSDLAAKTEAAVTLEVRDSFASTLSSAVSAYEMGAKQPSVSQTKDRGQMDVVLKELASLRTLLLGQGGHASAPVSELEKSVRRLLLKEGLDESYVDDLITTTLSSVTPGAQLHEALGQICAEIERSLGQHTEPLPIRSDSRIVAFVGPTGVGKTTTIAKIAALHVLAGQRKIGLLTTDTYRIAAVSQLQTYADILGVPLAVAEDASAIKTAFDTLSDCDLVLVDTAGRNFKEVETVKYTRMLLEAIAPDETMLVLSLTAKADDMDRLVDMCQTLNADKFLFTKLDETESVGAIVRLLAKYHRPMSYVTTGQNVPDDIDMLSVHTLLSRWVKED